MFEIVVEYDNGQRETLELEDGEQITMPRAGKVLEIRHNGFKVMEEKKLGDPGEDTCE